MSHGHNIVKKIYRTHNLYENHLVRSRGPGNQTINDSTETIHAGGSLERPFFVVSVLNDPLRAKL